MNHWNRVLYAFALGTAVIIIFVAVSMIFGLDTVDVFFSNAFWVPIFVVSYLVAPFLNRYIKRQ